MFLLYGMVHTTIYGQVYQTVEWFVQTINLNMKVHERDIQHMELICFSLAVFTWGVLWGAHIHCFSFLAFSKRTPEVHSFVSTKPSPQEPGLVCWCSLAPLQSSPQMSADFSACLHIIAVGLGLTFFPCFLFCAHFKF